MKRKPKPTKVQEPLMTLSDVAAYLQLAERTIYLWAQANAIPSFKLGNVWRFMQADIDAWIEEAKKNSPHGKKHLAA